MLIEDTKTTQNREITPGKIKGKVPQRERGSPRDIVSQESLTIACEKPDMAVGNSYLEDDNWDFLNNQPGTSRDQPGTSRDQPGT